MCFLSSRSVSLPLTRCGPNESQRPLSNVPGACPPPISLQDPQELFWSFRLARPPLRPSLSKLQERLRLPIREMETGAMDPVKQRYWPCPHQTEASHSSPTPAVYSRPTARNRVPTREARPARGAAERAI